MSDSRPANCRFRLQDEGKSYPRSSCQGCGKTIMTGLGKHCTNTRVDSIPSQDALICAALEVAAKICEDKARGNPRSQGQYLNAAHAIRHLKTKPEALVEIKAKAIENRT